MLIHYRAHSVAGVHGTLSEENEGLCMNSNCSAVDALRQLR